VMSKSLRVILIDDDPFILTLAKEIVRKIIKDDQVRTFSSAKDALNYLQTANDISEDGNPVPGIILSDLHMPCMDGFQFLDEFARLKGAVRSQYTIFILSSTTDDRERARLFEKSSFDGFCSKPLTPQKFIDLLEQVRCKY
jgi:two-component system chemotaxis response regulator CheY